MCALRVSETSSVLQAGIEGLQIGQIPVVNRLRNLGVPEDLIGAATRAENDAFGRACDLIIAWVSKEWQQTEEGALMILNGHASPVQTS